MAAAPPVDLDANSFGAAEPGSRQRAEAARPMLQDAFGKLPATARARVKRLKLAWGAGATEPVAWFRGSTLILQYFWGDQPARADVDFALGCAFTGPKGRCADQGD
jgi:hypothetical protein